MDLDSLKKMFGDEYPEAVVRDCVRIPLTSETKFTRKYDSQHPGMPGYRVSRFMDGSASITAVELQREWDTWKYYEREDFCQSCGWLNKQADFPDMLRFIMAHGSPDDCSPAARAIAAHLPREEAFSFLLRVLPEAPFEGSNIIRAIPITKHPGAEQALRKHLRAMWDHPKLWDDGGFNWVADAAETCIKLLIELGASPSEFEDQVRNLSEHPCANNRQSCRRALSQYYPWLAETAA